MKSVVSLITVSGCVCVCQRRSEIRGHGHSWGLWDLLLADSMALIKIYCQCTCNVQAEKEKETALRERAKEGKPCPCVWCIEHYNAFSLVFELQRLVAGFSLPSWNKETVCRMKCPSSCPVSSFSAAFVTTVTKSTSKFRLF